jgi:hypothetical protein
MDPYFPDKPITMRAAESRMDLVKGHLSIGLQSLNRGKCSTKSQALTKLLLVTLYAMQAKCL